MSTLTEQQVQQQQQQQQVQPMVQQVQPLVQQNDENINIATVAEGGRELSKTVLYVGNIPGEVSEDVVSNAFSNPSFTVKSIKLLHDKNNPGFNYSFVEFENPNDASQALETLTGISIHDHQLKITWAFQTQQAKSTDSFNLFIGDLSLEIDDDSLSKAFNHFKSLDQANVMWDMKTGRSRGYGFVSFKIKEDADDALNTMNGIMLGDRPIRLNWASHRQPNNMNNNNMNNMNSMNNNINNMNNMNNNNLINNNNNNNGQSFRMNNNNHHQQQQQQQQQQLPRINMIDNMRSPVMAAPILGPQSYEMVLRQTPGWLSVVYLGNLAHYTTQNDLIPLLQNFGYIVNFKLMADKGCAFVTYDSHERAALAIVQLSGFTINGRPLKCGWGKQGRARNN